MHQCKQSVNIVRHWSVICMTVSEDVITTWKVCHLTVFSIFSLFIPTTWPIFNFLLYLTIMIAVRLTIYIYSSLSRSTYIQYLRNATVSEKHRSRYLRYELFIMDNCCVISLSKYRDARSNFGDEFYLKNV